jgi:alkanesulfonate monooxygenase SsuD/methylene tetrahydromethanopterin reductase-like flavin-dependent oxidoreductase (luciferase family)
MLEPQLGMSMDQLVSTTKLVEGLGFGYVFRSDHLLPTDDRRGLDSPECWTSLGVVAASTKTLKFGPLVSPVGFRNPALLAKMACTLHSFSKGRLQLSVGAGWYEPEYKAHGFPFPSFHNRLEQFREALEIMIPLIRNGRVDYDGKHFSAHTDCFPRPSGELHVIVGTNSRPIVRLAAKHADEWNFHSVTAEKYNELLGVLNGSSDGRKLVVSEMTSFLLGRNESELMENAKLQIAKFSMDISPQDLVARMKSRGAPCGTVDEFVKQLRARVDSGIQRIYFQTLVPENTRMLELLADTLKSGV